MIPPDISILFEEIEMSMGSRFDDPSLKERTEYRSQALSKQNV